MKNLFLFVFTIFFCLQSFSQVGFEKGYYKDNNGVLHHGLIKNYDWRSNPESIEFRTSIDSEIINVRKENIEEFHIENSLKFKRFSVEIDRSSDSNNSLSSLRDPEFRQEILLLKVLLEGDANLYQYTDTNIDRFFYSTVDLPLQQLVSKRFQVSNTIRANSRFRQQLLNDLNCGGVTQEKVINLEYSKAPLLNYFVEFNECRGANYKMFETRTRGVFNLKVKAGVNYASLKIERIGTLFTRTHEVDFGGQINPTVGVEAEYLLPFNKNKWSIFAEPSIQRFKAEADYNFASFSANNVTTFTIDYISLSAPMGVKHYFFLGENSRISLSAALMVNYYLDSNVGDSKEEFRNEMVIKDFSQNFEFGVGYFPNNKFGVEMRYGLPRQIFTDRRTTVPSSFGEWESVGNSVLTFLLSYNLF